MSSSSSLSSSPSLSSSSTSPPSSPPHNGPDSATPPKGHRSYIHPPFLVAIAKAQMPKTQAEKIDLDEVLADVLNGKQRIVSYPGTSQYGLGGTGASACGLAAMNFARTIFRLEEFEIYARRADVKEPMTDTLKTWKSFMQAALSQKTSEVHMLHVTKDIVSICSSWPSDEHTEVEDLLKIPLFKNSFELVKVKYGRSNYRGFLALIKDLLFVNKSGHGSVAAAVITRPPEILICLRIPIRSSDIFIIFDSHPRPTHPLGSGFILNSSAEATALYLDGILATDPGTLSGHLAQLLGQYSSHVIAPKASPLPRVAGDMIDAILVDTSATILHLRAALAECQRRESNLLEENQDLQSKLTHLEQLQQSIDIKGKKKATFDCRICLESLARDDIAEFKGCQHSFCRSCLRSQIVSKLDERRYPIFCPACVADNADEPAGVDDEMFESLGPTDSEAAIYRELQLAAHSVKLHCRKCKETMFVDRVDYKTISVIACPLPRCNHVWCKNCQQAIEIGGPQHSCDGSSELEHLMKQKGWRHCPGCQTPIQKESGCNHMTCSSGGCNTHFCYLCGEMMIQSAVPAEIKTAISTHYNKTCKMFEDVAT